MTFSIRPKPLEISDADIFSNDCLGRQPQIVAFSRVIENSSTPLVMSLEGSFGSGKTEFINFWAEYLGKKGFENIIKFNAWENDYLADPILGLIQSLAKAPSLNQGSRKSLKVLTTMAHDFLMKAFRPFAKMMMLYVSGGLVNPGIIDATVDTLGESVEKWLAEPDIREKFRTQLKEVVSLKKGDTPIIFFIDDLDRCQPLFALSLLERIKHFFDVEGVVFVLAMNRRALESSVAKVYGNEMDAPGYLRRFFDLNCNLKSRGSEAKSLVNSFFARLEVATSSTPEQMNAVKVVFAAALEELSFRDLEKAISLFHILSFGMKAEHKHAMDFLAFLCCLRTGKCFDEVRDFVERNVAVTPIFNRIREERWVARLLDTKNQTLNIRFFLLLAGTDSKDEASVFFGRDNTRVNEIFNNLDSKDLVGYGRNLCLLVDGLSD